MSRPMPTEMHFTLWLLDLMDDPNRRDLIRAFQDPVRWGRAIRALGYPEGDQRGVDGRLGASNGPFDGEAEMGEDW